MAVIRKRRYWDVGLGTYATRVSMHNEHGDEYYAVVAEANTRQERRERMDRAVLEIEAAMHNGDDPCGVLIQ